MLQNYIKVALRGLRRNPSASIINILGLSIGLSCFILILIYVVNESGYDRFHSDSDQIFRLTTIDEALGVSSNNVAITNPRMPAAAREEVSGVIDATRILEQGRTRIERDEDTYYTEYAKTIEKNFFNIFDYHVNPAIAIEKFADPRKVILTDRMAETIFKEESAVGKVLHINDEDWEVVGIMDNPPPNTHLGLDMMMSMSTTVADSSLAQYLDSWGGLGMIGYVKLEDPTEESRVEEELRKIALANDVPEFWVPKLQPLRDIHLGSTDILFDYYHINKGDRVYVYSLSAVAVFILLIAAFNFMNLATAKSSTRAKDVGIRKVLGGARSHLIRQHLGESVLLVLLSTFIAFMIVILMGNMINLGIYEPVEQFLFSRPELIIFILLSAVLIGLLSGIYPAFVLSGFQTSSILRGKFSGSKKGIGLRKALVILQFTASITMIIGTVFIYRQIDFIKNKDLGFSKDQVVTFQMNEPGMAANMVGFRDRLLSYDGIAQASISANMPGRTFGRTGVTPEGFDPENNEDTWIVSALSFDHLYLDMMNMELAEGRSFNEGSEADQNEMVLVNEAFVNQIGWDDPVGKKVTLGNNDERTIIGVVKDFHFADMKHVIEPLIMFYNPDASGNISFRIKGDNIRATMDYAQEVWEEMYPEYPFEYEFFDQEF
ncbi:MAG: ABC transporter permease, partial [Cyclobacteriaceae bacterium]